VTTTWGHTLKLMSTCNVIKYHEKHKRGRAIILNAADNKQQMRVFTRQLRERTAYFQRNVGKHVTSLAYPEFM
jgi:hypothetical protein